MKTLAQNVHMTILNCGMMVNANVQEDQEPLLTKILENVHAQEGSI